MERAWVHCRKELIDKKDLLEDFDLYILQEAIRDTKSGLLLKRNIDRDIWILPPHMRQPVLDCLRRKSFVCHLGEEDSFNNWFIKCVELLSSLPNTPRRHLVSQSHRQIAPNLAPTLAPIPAAASPSYGPAPSDLAPSSSSSPNPKLLVEAPKAPSPSPNVVDSLPPPPKHFRPVHHAVPRNSPKKDDSRDIKKVVVIAAAAAGVLTILALLLFCCLKGGRNKIRDGQKDERPLLNLSISDFSAGMRFLSLTHYYLQL